MLCKIGEVEVWRILDLNGPFQDATKLFPNAGEDVAAVMEALAPGQIEASTGRVILPVQGFLLKTPHQVILVDACVGNHKTNTTFDAWHMRDDDRFMVSLAAAGITPEQVDYVFCTHLHVDHVGWNTRLDDGRWVPTFPNARYLLPAEDLTLVEASGHPMYDESLLPVVEAGLAEPSSADYVLGEEVSLIATPGHTAGHVSVRITSNGQEAVITGDAIHTTPQCHYPNWHFAYDRDPVQAVASRRALLESVSESGARVLGTHFLMPSLGRIRAKGDAFEWIAD